MIPGFLTAVKSVCGLWFVVKNSKTTNYFLEYVWEFYMATLLSKMEMKAI